MRLLRDELYKITSRRVVKICFAAALLIELFCILTGSVFLEYSVVDGVEYRGIAAIRQDRAMAEEYEGVLTDEKVADMAKKYGLMYFDAEKFNEEENFLSRLLFSNGLCDGYINSWSDLEQPSRTLPIAGTQLGRVCEYAGVEPEISYYRGWSILSVQLGIAGIMSCILLMTALTPVFAEEYASGTANILLATVHGRKKDIGARFVAAVLFSLGAFALLAGFVAAVCGMFYGYDGGGCLYGLNGIWKTGDAGAPSVSLITMDRYVLLQIVFIVAALFMLTAFSLFASAVCHTPFVALIVTVLFFVLPAGVWCYLALTKAPVNEMTMKIWHIILCTPLYACMNGGVGEMLSAEAVGLRAGMFAAVCVPSLILAWQMFRRHEAV